MKAEGCDPESVEYRKTLIEGALPEVYEFAFGYCLEGTSRRLVTGVNWSPGIVNPFRQLRTYLSLDSLLAEARANRDEPVVVFLQRSLPGSPLHRPGEKRGGTNVNGQIIIDGVQAVTKKWTRQRKAEEREANARSRRQDMW